MVGICGVGTSAIAIALHKSGWRVTGSDKGFYPPVSTYLSGAGVLYYAGWHPEKIEENGKPDIIMIGGVGTSPSNPEVIYAKENGIPVFTYTEIIRDYFIRKNSIVVAGTWGKTTTSALLSFIMNKAGKNPSYFTGGLSLSHPTGALTDTDWSLVEGDEYQTSITDKKPKFAYYSPTHLLLTSVSWDHADLYPTEEDYFITFEELVKKIPKDGLIVACGDNKGVTKVLNHVYPSGKNEKPRIVSYGSNLENDYYFHSIEHNKEGLTFSIDNDNSTYKIHSPMLGRFNTENITGAFAMAHKISIPAEKIIEAINDFKGIKRRFEKRFEGEVTVLDCHAPTAEKASAVLESIREVYKNKIIAIYEPNIGGRQRASAGTYDHAFKSADIIIIPRLTKLKVSSEKDQTAIEGDELAAIIGRTHPQTKYVEDDPEVIKLIISQAKTGDVIVFLGSHGFRGMIEEVVSNL